MQAGLSLHLAALPAQMARPGKKDKLSSKVAMSDAHLFSRYGHLCLNLPDLGHGSRHHPGKAGKITAHELDP